jgi:valyl-tRNA synthetase
LVLAQTLNRIVRLLHPYIPFITEEIYQKLPIRGKALIVDEYPTIYNDKQWLLIGSDTAALEMDVVREVVTAIRNIRTENRIKPSEKIAVRISPKDDRAQKILGNNKTAIMTLAKVDPCDITEAGSLSKCAVTPVRIGGLEINVIVPLEGLVDFDEEIKRIERVIEKTQKDIMVMTSKLGNENFLKNAPEELVKQDKDLLDGLKGQLVSLQESLARFQS